MWIYIYIPSTKHHGCYGLDFKLAIDFLYQNHLDKSICNLHAPCRCNHSARDETYTTFTQIPRNTATFRNNKKHEILRPNGYEHLHHPTCFLWDVFCCRAVWNRCGFFFGTNHAEPPLGSSGPSTRSGAVGFLGICFNVSTLMFWNFICESYLRLQIKPWPFLLEGKLLWFQQWKAASSQFQTLLVIVLTKSIHPGSLTARPWKYTIPNGKDRLPSMIF